MYDVFCVDVGDGFGGLKTPGQSQGFADSVVVID